ncbi:ER lumen protein-retaining receptor [Intoshia linei]|uniref:ER lumen protein-retaining receptor n=1 Tax=Intoshia linei TaxID=1819745 RepID=A0A177B716_9BILA|nr:ER lumen protein-retaining receptor [Intoshia linei]
MNIFRLVGDMSHLLAILLLLFKIFKSRSVAGLSGNCQLMFLIVFVTRYLDIFTNFVSIYNSSMKIVFIVSLGVTVFAIYRKFRSTYNSYIVICSAGLAFLVNYKFSFFEILWTFSIYLESVAILPQLFMITKTGEAETITSHYLFALGSYRALYLINWVWRFISEGHFDIIVVVAGIVQTLLYADFFYLYVTKVIQGKKLALPA